MPCHKMQWHQNRKTCSYFNAMPKTVMTSSKQQNEASKKKCESMSYATLYESMSMYAKSKTSNEFVNYECMSM
jgi:hypothetical protein